MMTKAEIEKLASEAVADMGYIFYDSTGDEDRGPVETTKTAEQAVAHAIEKALATVPRVSKEMAKQVEELVDAANWGDYVLTISDCDALAAAIDILKKLTPPDPPKPYSVLLVCPDYTTDDFGHDTYLAHVKAQDQKEAIYLARMQAWKDRDIDPEDEDFDPNCLDDYFVSLICEGHINDIKED